MDQAECVKRLSVLGPVFVRLVKMGHPVVFSFAPEHEYPIAIVPDYEDEAPEAGGLIAAAMIGYPECHLVKTDDDELLIVHREDT